MAMGDNIRSRNKNDYMQSRGENLYGNANAFLGAQGQQFQGDYNRAMQSDEQMRNAAMTGFQNYMNSGANLGLSAQAEGAMRNRAMSPVRSAYAGAQRDVNRMGMGAGRATMMGRLAREGGQQASDAASGAEVNIAQLREQAKQQRMQAMLQGSQGMGQLYGTAPGATNLQSRNVLENAGQGMNLLGNEFQRMQGTVGNQIAASQLPGKGQISLNNALNTVNTISNMWKPGGSTFMGQ